MAADNINMNGTTGTIDIEVFLKDPSLESHILKLMYSYYNNRYLANTPDLAPRGYKLKRTPESFFIDQGHFNPKYFINQFTLIISRQSKLSKSQRDCINYYVVSAMQRMYWEMYGENKDAEDKVYENSQKD